jgi:predicted nucleic acid-binding protein
LSAYLDASVLVALFVQDPLTNRARAILREHPQAIVVSDLAAAEFASAIARLVRIGDATADGARATFATFDAWTSRASGRAETTSSDIGSAAAFIRRLDLTLRAPDAIHIAIAQRIGADLLTFDRQMAAGARALGTNLIAG